MTDNWVVAEVCPIIGGYFGIFQQKVTYLLIHMTCQSVKTLFICLHKNIILTFAESMFDFNNLENIGKFCPA